MVTDVHIWTRDRRGEERMEKGGVRKEWYYYIPTDEGSSVNQSLVSLRTLLLK